MDMTHFDMFFTKYTNKSVFMSNFNDSHARQFIKETRHYYAMNMFWRQIKLHLCISIIKKKLNLYSYVSLIS